MQEKLCPKCGDSKPLASFYKNVTRKDGLTVYCKDCVKADNNKYNRENLQARLAYQRTWRANNREYVRERDAEYRKANPVNHSERGKKYSKRHPDRIRKKMRRFHQQNPNYYRHRHALRRGTSDGSITMMFLDELLEKQGGKCAYCNTSLGIDKHLDHIIPLRRNGTHTADNVHWTCPRCNRSKGVKLESEWVNRPTAQ